MVVRAGTSRIIAAIALICISGICGSVGNVAFMSWMGDLVPGHMRRFGKGLLAAAAVVTAWSVGWF